MTMLIQNQGLFMPLVWLVAALLVALILYRTSKAFLTADTLFGMPVKQVRLGGSIVIFVLVFLLLRYATTSDAILVPARSLTELGQAVDRLDAARADIDVCLATDQLDTPHCRNHVERMRDRWTELKLRADALVALGAPPEGATPPSE